MFSPPLSCHPVVAITVARAVQNVKFYLDKKHRPCEIFFMMIRTAERAIELLGGENAVRGLFDKSLTKRVVYNWKHRGFPPETFLVIAPRLSEAGASFEPYSLFGMRKPKK